MAKSYYGSKISENIAVTPEGFLICQNVPIARTGWQEYFGQELGIDDMYGQKVRVFRSEDEVFDPATLASFEGKPVTDEHPNDWVTIGNIDSYGKGHVQNVRRGTGSQSDLLIADIFIKNSTLISQVQEKVKREVSCGYDCLYVKQDDGTYKQVQIRGNHVAVVRDGRAGSRVAIKDTIPTKNEGGKRMKGKVTKDILAAMGFKQFVQDADPEEIAEATRAMGSDQDPVAPVKPVVGDQGEEGGGALAAILSKLEDISARLSALEQSDKQVHEGMDGLENLENELTGDNNGEENVVIPAEEMDASILEPGFTLSPEEKPKNPITGDRKAALDTIKTMKPIIAAITDPVERKKASDSLAAMVRSQIGTTVQSGAKDTRNVYGQIANSATAAANASLKAAEQDQQERNLGKDWAKKFNPHYKES